MKKSIVLMGLLAGLLAGFAIDAQALFAIQVSDLAVVGADDPSGSNVTVTATITVGEIAWGAQASLAIRATNGLVGQLFQPEGLKFTAVPPDFKKTADMGACNWTNISWNPYFTGDFIVTVTATLTNGLTLKNGFLPSDTASVTVTVARTFGGTVNSVKVQDEDLIGRDEKLFGMAYDPEGSWNNIDLDRVYLHSIGVMADPSGAVSIGCNLINVTNITEFMTEEQMDIAFTDTGDYRPVDTPFRFDVNMHARPTSLMGFGEVRRFVWTPVSGEAPDGPGRLVVDVLSCSPWRNNYATNLRAHVGFAPLFAAEPEMADELEGLIMCTTAHYMDVSPDCSDVGIGLKVNGHSNTTSYLKSFISDTTLARWGIPVDRAEELLSGYVTHFNISGESEGDTAAVTTEFTRIAGGGTNYAYYNADGDSGFEAHLTFTFHSPVAAQIGISAAEGDFDGDRKADPYVVDAQGNWFIFYSMGGYQSSGSIPAGQALWQAVVADFDGDSLADPAMVDAAGNWYFWYSLGLYARQGPYVQFEHEPGWQAVAADFDGDRKADPAMVDEAGNWYICYSLGGYARQGPYSQFGHEPGWQAVAGDFDADGKADPAMVDESGNWYICYSLGGYARQGPYEWGLAGWRAVVGDFDGDRVVDPAMVLNNNWICRFSRGGFAPQGPFPLVP